MRVSTSERGSISQIHVREIKGGRTCDHYPPNKVGIVGSGNGSFSINRHQLRPISVPVG